ncbi:DoxX protein [Candidatus Woesearchaeota archaeon]|nr:DoxX protein [Candidatus Woesearchaeota archaeon]
MNKKVILTVRILFGIILIIFGGMAFLNLEIPDFYPAEAKLFLEALAATGYMNPIIGIIFIIAGLMFVLGMYVALGAILLAPILVNIILFHIFLDIKSIIIGLVFALLNIFIAYTEWDKYKPLLRK